MMGETHLGFIVAAYVIGALVIGGMTLAILLDYARLKRALTKIGGRTGLDPRDDR
jgi:NhaP-type Na+/H+ or K+/H+ antiporter